MGFSAVRIHIFDRARCLGTKRTLILEASRLNDAGVLMKFIRAERL